MPKFEKRRALMKSGFGTWEDDMKSDQEKGISEPPLEEDRNSDKKVIKLPTVDPLLQKKPSIFSCIADRRSRRAYTEDPLSMNELGFLLWATQGVERIIPAYHQTGSATLRTVPSAGARHPFETYLAANHVDGLEAGIYRYLALSHDLVFEGPVAQLRSKLTDLSLDQTFVGEVPVVLFWVCIPYRGEWRYHHEAHKLMLLDAGHVCQNLYLAAEAIQCGTCAIAAYDQLQVDTLLGLDGDSQYVTYFAPVGKRPDHILSGSKA